MKLQITNYKLQNKGFTLIELLVVITIIGVLVTLTMFNFQQARERARDVQRKSEIKAIQDALEIYKNDHMPQSYPTPDLSALVPGDIKVLPIDPQAKVGVWTDYTYVRASPLQYTLSACLENQADKDASGAVCSTTGKLYTITQP